MGGREGRWGGGGAGACLTSINLHVSRGPSHLNYRKELNLCLLMKVKDLEVRDSSRVVSSYAALWSTFCLFTQVYKWVPATQFPGGRTPYNGLYGEAPPERGTFTCQASGIRIWNIRKGREICHLGLWKGLKGLTDEFRGFIKSRKRSICVIDSYLKDRASTTAKRGAKF